MLDARDVGCLGCGMWDVGSLPGCGMLIYKMPNKISVHLLPTCLDVCLGRSNSVVRNVHKRALRIVYDDHNSSYSELLMTKNEPTVHQQNINVLMNEIDKFEDDLSPR